MVPPVMTSASGVDGVRDGKPPGARGGFQILGMVRGERLRLTPRRMGEERVAGSLLAPGLPQAVRLLLAGGCCT